jgi:hypothetical protein
MCSTCRADSPHGGGGQSAPPVHCLFFVFIMSFFMSFVQSILLVDFWCTEFCGQSVG